MDFDNMFGYQVWKRDAAKVCLWGSFTTSYMERLDRIRELMEKNKRITLTVDSTADMSLMVNGYGGTLADIKRGDLISFLAKRSAANIFNSMTARILFASSKH